MPSLDKISLGCQEKFAAGPTGRFQFQKRRQLFIRTHNETPSIVAMCFLLCRLTQTGESPSFLRWYRKFSLTRRGGATHRRSSFRVKMNTILIFSLVILLFGFDSSSRNESIRFQR
jgi:hypothetical protein